MRELAQRALSGAEDPLYAARHLFRMWAGLGRERWENESAFQDLLCLESELDRFPLGSERDLWSKESLREVDADLAEIRTKAYDEVMNACRRIIELFEAGEL
jgi:hypothetical protein